MSETADVAGGSPICLVEHSYGVHASTDPNSKFFRRAAEELGFEVVAPELTDLVPVEDDDPILVIPSLSEQATRVRAAMGQLHESEIVAASVQNGRVQAPRQAAVVLADSQGLLVHGMAGRSGDAEQLIALAPPLYGSVVDRIVTPLDRRAAQDGRYQAAAEPYGGAFGVTKVPGTCDVVVSADYVEEVGAIEAAGRLWSPSPENSALWPIGAYVAVILGEYAGNRVAPRVLLPNPDSRLDTTGQLAALAVLDELIPNLSAERVDDAGGHRFMNAHGRAVIKQALASARVKVSEADLPSRIRTEDSALAVLQD